MALNLKNDLFSQVAEQLGVERKKLHTPHTDHSQMGELKVFTIFSNHVWQNISLEIENGMM